jgi:hypothetical protein
MVHMVFYINLEKYYIVDAGYPNHRGYLAPCKGERYHIPEWYRGTKPKTSMERFNRVHSTIRNVIERSFGLLKMRWPILWKIPPYPMYKQKMSVVATMICLSFVLFADLCSTVNGCNLGEV